MYIIHKDSIHTSQRTQSVSVGQTNVLSKYREGPAVYCENDANCKYTVAKMHSPCYYK
jgi:hypothetical protein